MKQHGDTCGCCVGLQARTPAEVVNSPRLHAIAYRAGTWASFRETMLAAFAKTRTKSGDVLDARSSQNFATALADAWAVVGDILTFYQERIANESYLRTATERRSVLELARMIGYELKPGVAAETWLAFTIDDPPAFPPPQKTAVASLPLPARRDALLESGLKVQSVPGPDEKPQLFETVETITGWPEWNAIPLRVRQPQLVDAAVDVVHLTGDVTPPLVPGEYLLLDVKGVATVKRVDSVQFDALAGVTIVNFGGSHSPPDFVPLAYVELEDTSLARTKVPMTSAFVTPEIAKKPWRAEDLGTVAAFQGWDLDELAASIYRHAQRDVTALENTTLYRFRQKAAVFGHNAPDPATFPPEGAPNIPDVGDDTLATDGKTDKTVHLDTVYPGIATGTWAFLRALPHINSKSETVPGAEGPYKIQDVTQVARSKYLINARTTRLTLDSSTDFEKMAIRTTTVFAETVALPVGTEPVDPAVDDPNAIRVPRKGLILDGVFLRLRPGRRVIVTGKRIDLEGETGAEQRTLIEVRIQDGLTIVSFDTPLAFDYDWTTVTVNANVARATHGESTKETLGSGDASRAYQRFTLRQKPLTYTGASTASGSESSLRVFVNDVKWQEADMLFGRAPTERVYTTQREDDGTTTVQFGDGLTGARVPTGSENVRAEYRKGIGLEGLVDADQLTILLTRPLGAKGVTNPLPAVDAGDPEPRDEARRNAPLQVLTLDRAVTLRDFEDFARGFAGVAKSLATRISGREKPGVFVTVAAANGAAFTRTGELATALRDFGDPFVPIVVKTFKSVLFRVEATVKIEPDRIPAVVQKAVEQALRERYSFDSQSFGQPLFRSEVISVVQSVEGVLSTTVTLLDAEGKDVDRIAAVVPFGDVTDATPGAELLSLDPRPVKLTVTT